MLQGLVTNDIEGLSESEARHAGLLSPQGKILFDFFVIRHGDGYLLDVVQTKAADLVKRLTIYKIRAQVTITDVSDSFKVYAAWGADSKNLVEGRGISFPDPRHRSIGLRLLVGAGDNFSVTEGAGSNSDSTAGYDALRVTFGIPEGGKDYEYGDAYPHEADFDLLNGVSFTKGCYVGQEVVARMQNKTIVRKRAIKVSGNAPLEPNSEIFLGDISAGRIGTAAGEHAIAMLRLDRVLEAEQKRQPLIAAGIAITPEEDAVDRYRTSVAARAASTSVQSTS
ncbi:MAG TPA: folate-binding protein [Hyphomicrobium sp.]|nr:folate-binding protein [Hyphomicrobium sp.]